MFFIVNIFYFIFNENVFLWFQLSNNPDHYTAMHLFLFFFCMQIIFVFFQFILRNS